MKKFFSIIIGLFSLVMFSGQTSKPEDTIPDPPVQTAEDISNLQAEAKYDAEMIEHRKLKNKFSKNVQETLEVTYRAVASSGK